MFGVNGDESFLNCYEILGLDHSKAESITQKDIAVAYRKKSVALHPDKNQSNPQAKEVFQRLGQAYEILNDPQKRKRYDRLCSLSPDERNDIQEYTKKNPVTGLLYERNYKDFKRYDQLHGVRSVLAKILVAILYLPLSIIFVALLVILSCSPVGAIYNLLHAYFTNPEQFSGVDEVSGDDAQNFMVKHPIIFLLLSPLQIILAPFIALYSCILVIYSFFFTKEVTLYNLAVVTVHAMLGDRRFYMALVTIALILTSILLIAFPPAGLSIYIAALASYMGIGLPVLGTILTSLVAIISLSVSALVSTIADVVTNKIKADGLQARSVFITTAAVVAAIAVALTVIFPPAGILPIISMLTVNAGIAHLAVSAIAGIFAGLTAFIVGGVSVEVCLVTDAIRGYDNHEIPLPPNDKTVLLSETQSNDISHMHIPVLGSADDID